MAKSIHPSIHPCVVSFLFIPSLYILLYTLRNILPEAVCCCFFMPCYWNCLMYMYVHVCQLSLLQLLIWISYLDRLPEAICCCLPVNDVLLVMYSMCLPAFLSLVLINASLGSRPSRYAVLLASVNCVRAGHFHVFTEFPAPAQLTLAIKKRRNGKAWNRG